MILIFGWGHTTHHDYGPTLLADCRNCSNDNYWNLTRIRTWFTLFFIPVIPYQTKHILFCNVCGNHTILRGEQIDKALKLNEATTRFRNQELTEWEYEAQLEKIRI